MTSDSRPSEGTAGSRLWIRIGDEEFTLEPHATVSLGREADIAIDPDNFYLHRRLLEFRCDAGVWWIENVGNSTSVALTGGSGAFRAWLGPGVRLPVVLPEVVAAFSAGSESYEIAISSESAPYRSTGALERATVGTETLGEQSLTPSQRMLILALAEPILAKAAAGYAGIPTSAAAAARLKWPLTTFNRKLDNVCDKFDRFGVPGMRGGPGNLAVNRKARLVEYAVLSGIVRVEDLPLLDAIDNRSLHPIWKERP